MNNKIQFNLLIFLFTTCSIFGQWMKTNGADTSNVTCFTKLNNSLFAGALNNGILKSINGGNSWISKNNGLPDITDLEIIDLKVMGSDIFVGIDGAGVFFSSDEGENWTSRNNGLTDPFVHSLGILGTKLFAGSTFGIFVSTDEGQNWIESDIGWKSSFITSFATIKNLIFIGAFGENGGVYLSSDGGTNWNIVNNNLFDNQIISLISNDSDLIAGTVDHLFKSSDFGENWIENSIGLPYDGIKPIVAQNSLVISGTFNKGVYFSTNYGAYWSSFNSGLNKQNVNAGLIFDNTILIGTENGIWKRLLSEASPQTGTFLITTYNTGQIEYSIFKDGFIGDIGNNSGVGFKYSDNNNALFSGGLLLGTQDNGISGSIGSFSIHDIQSEGFLQKDSSNSQFQNADDCYMDDNISPSPFNVKIHQETYSAQNSNILYVKYTVNNNSSSDIQNLYIGQFADWDIGDYSTNNGGKDDSKSLVYQYGRSEDMNYYGLVALNNYYGGISLTDGSYDRNQLFSWMTFTGDDTSGSGDYRSFISSGPYNIPVGGSIQAGFAYTAAPNLAQLKANSDEAIATWNSGALVDAKEKNLNVPSRFLLSQNYPNPFNPSTTINYSIPKASFVSLKVYDILGNEVETLVNEEKTAGNYSLQFSTAKQELASGIYFYRLQAGSFTNTKKLNSFEIKYFSEIYCFKIIY